MNGKITLPDVKPLWLQALAEDGADRDVTSQIVMTDATAAVAHINARAEGVFAGRVILDLIADLYPDRLKLQSPAEDGQYIRPGDTLATLQGPLPFLLAIERTLLNFLERLTGVATLTSAFVQTVAGTNAKIYDTRKTIPGWRSLDKYAVRCGRGHNHRMGLHDAVLVKDNHLAGIPTEQLAGAVTAMIQRGTKLDRQPDFVEFEVDNLQQLNQLLPVTGIDVILLDNFTLDQMREAVRLRNELGLAGKLALEASGNVTLQTARDVAETGVERIAVGAVTHSAPALDIGMDIEPKPADR